MFPAFALALALNVLQPADTPSTKPTPPPATEATPVDVPPATPTALRYYTSGNRLWVLDQVVSMALLATILFTGFSATLRNWAQQIGRNWFFTTIVYVTLFTIVTFVITLPRKSPRRWWLYTAGTAIPSIVIADLVAPVWIAPLFNRFEPMHDKALEMRILALADRAGIEGSRVFEGQQERRYENAECVCRGPLADQADRPVGHDHCAHGRSRTALRDGPRDGPHPPLGERIEFSNDYHPWREGAPLRYGPRFRN